MLISPSDKDDAVGKAFPLAHDLNFFARLNPNTTSSTGLGATGPSAATTAAFLTNQQVAVARGSTFAGTPPPLPRLEARLWWQTRRLFKASLVV